MYREGPALRRERRENEGEEDRNANWESCLKCPSMEVDFWVDGGFGGLLGVHPRIVPLTLGPCGPSFRQRATTPLFSMVYSERAIKRTRGRDK
jgi:hypothetical protein